MIKLIKFLKGLVVALTVIVKNNIEKKQSDTLKRITESEIKRNKKIKQAHRDREWLINVAYEQANRTKSEANRNASIAKSKALRKATTLRAKLAEVSSL